MRKIKNKFSFFDLLSRIFNKLNLNKFLIIFIVGFTSRLFINYIYNVNVFIEYFSKVSIIYYVLMSMFIVLIQEIITYFDINIIPYYLFNYITNLSLYLYTTFINMKNIMSISYNSFKDIKLKDLTIPSIVKILKELSIDNFSDKICMTNRELYINSKNISSDINSKLLYKNSSDTSNNNKSPKNDNKSPKNDINHNKDNTTNISNNKLDYSDRTYTVKSKNCINKNNNKLKSSEQDSLENNDKEIYFGMDDLSSIISNSPKTSPRTPSFKVIPERINSPEIICSKPLEDPFYSAPRSKYRTSLKSNPSSISLVNNKSIETSEVTNVPAHKRSNIDNSSINDNTSGIYKRIRK
jgi:hypothetical protein